MIDYIIKPDKYDKITVEEAEKHMQLVNQLNYLIEEGFITVQEDEDGRVRLYPA